ncbi:MAG: GrpB family protein [Rhodobacteraceae bacterium]|nr:GrpB family protein [Alphaproteobacteria bacterium]NNF70622.1 GrpB family protein [Paracoccaceae bacterium]NNK67477.1 GrpB family protein [Paracoccaceae bacterium]
MTPLQAHDPDWTRTAAAEAAHWLAIDGVRAVLHIGSTSIPGIAAKPVIDLLPVFESEAAMQTARNAVEALGYDWMGEFGLPGRAYARKDDPVSGARLIQAHGYVTGSPDIKRHLAFRDLLRATPALAKAYEAEKRRCAKAHPQDSVAYGACKAPWIDHVEAAALEALAS